MIFPLLPEITFEPVTPADRISDALQEKKTTQGRDQGLLWDVLSSDDGRPSERS